MIRTKGGGDNFTIGTWANEYKKLSPESKIALFADNHDLVKAHDTLIGAIDLYKDVGKFGNPSRSGYTNSIANLITNGVAGGAGAAGFVSGIPAAVGALGTAYTTNRVLSSMLASPKLTKYLAAAVKAPDEKSYNKIVSTLVKAATAEGIAITPEELNQSTNDLAPQPIEQPAVTREMLEQILREKEMQEPQPVFIDEQQGNAGNDTLSSLPDSIKQAEGIRYNSYKDTTGNTTVGYGFNMQSGIAPKLWKQAGIQTPFADVYRGKAAISPQEAEALFTVSKSTAFDDAQEVYKKVFNELPPQKQEALVNLAYQHGRPSLIKNHAAFNAAVNRGEWVKAVNILKRSDYAGRYKSRAQDIARALMS
jgi:GH24 family phage-related lysozyme (muramidase)